MIWLYFLVYSLACVHSTQPSHSHKKDTILELANGPVVGTWTREYRMFRGLPYAEPPVGELRFRPPEPKKSWKPEIWDAREFRHNCLQDSSPDFMGWPQPLDTLSEDCLYLNVYAPASTPVSPVPVLLWIHGGAFTGGGGNETRLHGGWDVSLLGGNISIVTINYRLGLFGFLAARELRSLDPKGGTGNYGILDQRLAMEWVRDNIHAFGGDPSRVFIVGQSAGANSVSQHLVRPRSWGLFSSAGLESGAFYNGLDEPTVDSQKDQFLRVLRRVGCTERDAVSCLTNAPALMLLNASIAEGSWNPVIDGVDLVDAGVRLAMQGQVAKVPVLVGSVSEDGLDVNDPGCLGTECSEEDFRTWARSAFAGEIGRNFTNSEVDRMAELYGNDVPAVGNFTNWYWAIQHAGADQWSGCFARRTAKWMTDAGQDAFFYRWTYAPKGVNGQFPKLAHHACEQPFVFHVLSETAAELQEDGGKYHIDKTEIPLSAAVVHYWASMAAEGRPRGNVTWPTFDLKQRGGLVIGASITSERNLRGPQCDFWDEVSEPKAQIIV